MRGLYAELRHRKVVRVAVVYAATAFVLLQVAELFTTGLGLPAWFFPAVTVLLTLGFPVALVLAWALELTPDERGFVGNRAESFVEPLVRRGNRLAALPVAPGPVEMKQAIVATRTSGVAPPDALGLVERAVPDPRWRPTYLFMLGAYDLAAEAGLPLSSALYWDPAHAGMRGTPAFKRIVERLGLPAYWREHGSPLCRPVGVTDFECDR